MDRALLPATYVQRLTEYLAGGSVKPLLTLFAEDATIERYVHGEPPRTYCGIEQIEESLLRLPPTGGSFHVERVRVEDNVVHARFYTHDFPYPLRGMYRFELGPSGQISLLTIASKYARPRSDRT